MDLKEIRTLYEESLRMNPEPTSEADRNVAKELVSTDEPFKRFLANLNIDQLTSKRPDFANDDDIVRELDDVIQYIDEQLNNNPLYLGQIMKVGSCIDDSKVHRVDEADTLYVLKKKVEVEQKTKENSFEIKGVGCPSKFVSDFADCIETIMQNWHPTGVLKHGGCLKYAFSGVRYNGPAVTALFVYEKEDQPLYLSLDVTPTFCVPKQFIPKEMGSNIELLKKKQPDKIYDMTGIYLFPNIINDEWQLTTAHFEARFFRDLPKRSPLKQAYNFVKIISHMINRTNEKGIFMKLLNSSSSSKIIEKEILQALEHQEAPETYKFMRYGHLFLTKEIAKSRYEIGKSTIAINTSAMKHILLAEAFRNPYISGESPNIEDDVYKLVVKAFELFLDVKSGGVPHALLRCNISIYSISKPSLIDGIGSVLQCVLNEQCRAIYNKINIQDSSDENDVDPGTCVLQHLKEYAAPIIELTEPRYHFIIPFDASFSPRRNTRAIHIYKIISACSNSCGGTISMSIDNYEIIDDETLARWTYLMSKEIEQRFKDVSVSFDEQFYNIKVEPSVHLVNVNFDGDKSYTIQADGFVVMNLDLSAISPHKSTEEGDVPFTSTTSKHHALHVPSTECSSKNNQFNTHDTTSRSDQRPESQEAPIDADVQMVTGTTEATTSPEHTSEGGPPIDQLKRTHLLTWTKTSDWETHLTPPQRDFLFNYELHSQTFVRTSPLCVYPSLSLLDERLHDQIHAVTERHKGRKGFLLWSHRLMNLFEPGCELPDLPEGHQLDVLCVWEEHTLVMDLCAIIEGRYDAAECQSYLAHTGRLLKFLMTQRIRDSKWMTTGHVLNLSLTLCVGKQVKHIKTLWNENGNTTETAKDIVNRQLASLSLLLLEKTHMTNLQVQLAESTLINLSYEQSRAVISTRKYNWIEGPPGSGKSIIALYVCDQYGKDKTAFICTTQSYKAFVEFQNKATVFIVESKRQLNELCHHLADFTCIIIDDTHNLPCSKSSVLKLLKTVHVNQSDIFLFSDCRYQNYKYPENSEIKKWIRIFCANCDETLHDPILTEVHRNTRKVASFLSAGISAEGEKGVDTITCAHNIDGNDVIFKKTFNLTSSSDENGVLVYVQSLLNSKVAVQDAYEPHQIVILLDGEKSSQQKNIKILSDVLKGSLKDVDVHGANKFPRTGIVVDSLDNFMGLDAPVCIFPVIKEKPKPNRTFVRIINELRRKRTHTAHKILDFKYKMFIASRAVHLMAFLMEDFDAELFDAMNMQHIKSWEPDYHQTGPPQMYNSWGSGEGAVQGINFVAACPRTGRLVVTDHNNGMVHIVTGELQPVVSFGSREKGEFKSPAGVTVTSAGEVYVTDKGLNRIQVHDLDGTYRRKFGSLGSDCGQYNSPTGIAHHDDRLYVCDHMNSRVTICDMEGRHITEISLSQKPWHIAVSRDGQQLAVSDIRGGLHLMTTAGVLTRKLRKGQGGILEVTGVCYDGFGHLIVADKRADCLRVLNQDGSQVCEINGPGDRDELHSLQGVTVTADGSIVACETVNQCIYMYRVPGLS